jgi:hypothetical protein
MKFLVSIEHPAWAHQFRYVINSLRKKGHEVKVVAIRKDVDLELLDAFSIPYEVISPSSGKNLLEKGIIFLKTTYRIFQISRKFKPEIYFGRASPMMALNSFIFRKPHIIFEDTEHSRICLLFCRIFSSVIMTPECFMEDLGRKQIRIPIFKELFYLHPRVFKPNPESLEKVHLSPGEAFIILRLIAWDAHHDIGQYGILDTYSLIKELEKFGRILISSESDLPATCVPYQLHIPPEIFHDLLSHATMHVGEGATVAIESALLGTPSIYISSLAGSMGNLIEFEENYHLVYSFRDSRHALEKAVDLLKTVSLKQEWGKKRDALLRDTINPSEFFLWFLENYPECLDELGDHPEILDRFR